MSSIVEEKIQEALRRGEFNNLPGSGKPLKLEDDSAVPQELRASYKLLKNAGVLPEEMQLRKDMVSLEQLLACCRDDGERVWLDRELSLKRMRYQSLMEARGWSGSASMAAYEDKIRQRLTAGDHEDGNS
ncbi:DnaJ family domain-containing protein [Paenibacillus daejeonensis]|uniref:DnaJ family domain-containing protein n=1 Tax=Paenibacillus daejeonensis TaxID=135193 RepID=UPI00316ABD9E